MLTCPPSPSSRRLAASHVRLDTDPHDLKYIYPTESVWVALYQYKESSKKTVITVYGRATNGLGEALPNSSARTWTVPCGRCTGRAGGRAGGWVGVQSGVPAARSRMWLAARAAPAAQAGRERAREGRSGAPWRTIACKRVLRPPRSSSSCVYRA